MNQYSHIKYFTQWETVSGRRVQRVLSCSGIHIADIIDRKGVDQFMAQLTAQVV